MRIIYTAIRTRRMTWIPYVGWRLVWVTPQSVSTIGRAETLLAPDWRDR
jgi:hypothetical protein